MIAPSTTLQGARVLARRLVEGGARATPHRDLEGRELLTLSIGVTTALVDSAVSSLQTADRQLYRAKARGRDQWR